MCFITFVHLSFFIRIDYALVHGYVLLFQLGMFLKFHVIGGSMAKQKDVFVPLAC
jgi:hypothetical protein